MDEHLPHHHHHHLHQPHLQQPSRAPAILLHNNKHTLDPLFFRPSTHTQLELLPAPRCTEQLKWPGVISRKAPCKSLPSCIFGWLLYA